MDTNLNTILSDEISTLFHDLLDSGASSRKIKQFTKYIQSAIPDIVNFKIFLKNNKPTAEFITLLGFCYENGIKVQMNKEYAFECYEIAAKRNDHYAQCLLGECYKYGKGTRRNHSLAFYWFLQSANNNNIDAQNKLADCYMNAKAFQFFFESAIQGHSGAQNSLGFCYFEGRGTIKDENKAFIWFRESANSGFCDAYSGFGYCFEKGIGTSTSIHHALRTYYLGVKKGVYACKMDMFEVFRIV
ncbi:2102_t:CDS:2 [Ambispora leptoticha]|uniref:2102_t:CDS:1 n=1 Tax=Ambispora leptoticha TaxID=144679 RepID=A0A9N9FDW0_9GLOM|nr:2102_t:CDS:2 [Ambispora leptoticha]